MVPRTQLASHPIVLLLVLNLLTYLQCRRIASRLETKNGHIDWFDRDKPFLDASYYSSFSSKKYLMMQNSSTASWIGDYWIPSSWSGPTQGRLYSAQELRSFFGKESILFIGDSTARRAFTTLYYVLNSTDEPLDQSKMSDPDIIDVNRKGRPQESCPRNPDLQLCRSMPQNPNLHADYAGLSCNSGVVNFLETMDMTPYTLLVVAYGGWHQAGHCRTTKGDRYFMRPKLDEAANRTFQVLKQMQHSNLTVVWRTMAMPQEPSSKVVKQTHKINDFFMELIRQHEATYWRKGRLSSLTALDWAQILEPRAIPAEDRIEGDMPYHFGFEARIVFLQMLMHHLVTRKQQQQDTSMFR